ncbi:hypothetical protein GALMADRAFT_922310 [Galerina marginata CBS 339.88]|uniref:Uncharacterized protein n=1 Tax=Galerina marginata (strain CBS 339.88) TaxID=685588 RepID=A0A067SP79_GALM3|nr:hypothetical protein GALMADRAFT_922310 [Galerina marginata CBS 339.88]
MRCFFRSVGRYIRLRTPIIQRMGTRTVRQSCPNRRRFPRPPVHRRQASDVATSTCQPYPPLSAITAPATTKRRSTPNEGSLASESRVFTSGPGSWDNGLHATRGAIVKHLSQGMQAVGCRIRVEKSANDCEWCEARRSGMVDAVGRHHSGIQTLEANKERHSCGTHGAGGPITGHSEALFVAPQTNFHVISTGSRGRQRDAAAIYFSSPYRNPQPALDHDGNYAPPSLPDPTSAHSLTEAPYPRSSLGAARRRFPTNTGHSVGMRNPCHSNLSQNVDFYLLRSFFPPTSA